jgi:hypothetical protein
MQVESRFVPPMESFPLRYTETLVRRAIWAFWWRSTGYLFFVTLFMLLAVFVYLFAIGDRSWWLGALGTVLGAGALVAATLYVVHFQRSMTRFRRMKSKEATFEICDDRFRMTSDVGSTELSWSVITKVWTFPEFWLLFYSAAQFTILPLDDLSLDKQAMILVRLKSHGAEVT